jgi:hypothetical protein
MSKPGELRERYLKVSWFSGNWNVDRLALASWEGHPTKAVAASCCKGLSLWCQSR